MHIEARHDIPADINLYPEGITLYLDDTTVEEFVECYEEDIELHPNQDAKGGLEFCYRENCGSNLVHPVLWQTISPTESKICLRCPECETYSVGNFSAEAAEDLNWEMEDRSDDLLRWTRRAMHERFEEEIDTFVEALEDDHVLPEDF